MLTGLAKLWYRQMQMKTVVTHNGSFHSDEVFAIATLQLVYGKEEIEIIRTREESIITSADIVVDVGGVYDPQSNRFDHHQTDGPVRPNSIPYAAFGLVWKEYSQQLVDESIASHIEETLVQPIDAGDNGLELYKVNEIGVKPTELYAVVSSYHPIGIATDVEYYEAFLQAVDFARCYVERIIKHGEHIEEEKKKAEELYIAATDKSIIVSPQSISRGLFNEYEEPLVVVSPSPNDSTKWRASTVPVRGESFETRVKFPSSWAGLSNQELINVSGIEGAQFCHKGGFLFVCDSKEGAITAAKIATKNI